MPRFLTLSELKELAVAFVIHSGLVAVKIIKSLSDGDVNASVSKRKNTPLYYYAGNAVPSACKAVNIKTRLISRKIRLPIG